MILSKNIQFRKNKQTKKNQQNACRFIEGDVSVILIGPWVDQLMWQVPRCNES